MKLFGYFRPFILVLSGIFFICQPAQAEALKDTVSKLEVLPLLYGANNIKTSVGDTLLVRGKLKTESAWGGDIYTVLVKNGDAWEMARHENGAEESVLTTTNPHTEEDSITSIRFMISKENKTSDGSPILYLLKASRKYDPDSISTAATFTFYVLEREKNFGLLFFRKVQEIHPKTKYCNADLALNKELGIPFPGDKRTYLICISLKKRHSP